MTDMEAKITITVDPTENKSLARIEGNSAGTLLSLETYLDLWLNVANRTRKPETSDAEIAKLLLDTAAHRIAAKYGESVLLPVLFWLACKNRGDSK